MADDRKTTQATTDVSSGSSAREQLAAMRGDSATPIEVFLWPPSAAESEQNPAGRDDAPKKSAHADRNARAADMASVSPIRSWTRTGVAYCARARTELGHVLSDVEDGWLGRTHRSWFAMAHAAGFERDQALAYCPRCGTSVGPYEADVDGCPTCRGKRLQWERSVRLGTYEGVLRQAVLESKYTPWPRMCRELGMEIGLALDEALRRSQLDRSHVVICPVPTSRRRRLSRGIDHTLVMAREVGRVTGTRVVRAVGRQHGQPQTGLSAHARKKNVSGVFVCKSRLCAELDGSLVVLVDDVRTTGATLAACSRTLKQGLRANGRRLSGLWSAVAAVSARGHGRHHGLP